MTKRNTAELDTSLVVKNWKKGTWKEVKITGLIGPLPAICELSKTLFRVLRLAVRLLAELWVLSLDFALNDFRNNPRFFKNLCYSKHFSNPNSNCSILQVTQGRLAKDQSC